MWVEHPKLPSWRDIAAKSGLSFALLFAISACIATALFFNERRVQMALLENNQRQHVDSVGQNIIGDLQAVTSDLSVLAEGKTMAAVVAEDSQRSRAQLAEDFQLFARQKNIYDQIRYLNNQGQEVVRVNRRHEGVQIVPRTELQSKEDRYYFRHALALGRREIYVSPFDLNVENGQIEQPPKPTIRFGTPVFDASNRKQGVIVINYLGQHLLDEIERSAAGKPGHLMLLNGEGFWLKGPDPQKQWAFMYAGKHHSFSAELPEAWFRIASTEEGQFQTLAGLFTFATVYPAERLQRPVSDRILYPADHWKLVSHVPPRQLAAQSGPVLKNILSLLGGVTVLLAVISGVLGWSLVQQEASRRRLVKQEQLAAIGAAMTVLAHESRNALQRSQAGLEMLARRLPRDDDTTQLLDAVQNAQYDLRDLYERVRDWTAPLQLQPEVVDLCELARNVWDQLEPTRREADLLEVEPAGEEVRCQVDRRMFGQVLRNLFENALAAANPAHIRCVVDPRTAAGRVRMRVSDNGTGLDEEQARRLFEPFFTTRMRGTGLGLAISRRIVRTHGGTIELDRSHHSPAPMTQGTEIVIDLPREIT